MDDREYTLVKKRVRDLVEVDLNHYKAPQVRRRLSALLVRSGQKTWSQYFRQLEGDPEALRGFKNYLTINVSEFYRDAPKWAYLEEKVLPELLKKRTRMRIWSAGCSHGAEAYTLAMILDQARSFSRGHYILATDIDRGMLDVGRRGGPYSADDVKDVEKDVLRRYFDHNGDGYLVKPTLRSRVNFRHHDLLNDPFEKDFDLIACRNVVIYFTRETKRMLYRRFADALRPGGVLFVGGTEIISSVKELPLRSFHISFYQKHEAA